jgi:AhpD family alkylhydroperoxidase
MAANYEFRDARFDPDITALHGLAKQMAGAFGHGAPLVIEPILAQLLRLRVAQKNECAYCVILHTRKAQELDIDEAKISGLAAWYNSDLYTSKEKAVLDYCDALNLGVDREFDAKHEALVEQGFDEQAIAEFASIVINMNVWTRLKLAQGATPIYPESSS